VSRPAASIIIPAWNGWELTRICLDALRPTLGIHDEVIVVDNGSVDGTAAGLRRYPWARVVTHEENRGFAGGCNGGASVATGDIVVFLNSDTVPTGRWLDGLLAPFADSGVVATGPRSNMVSGPQLDPDARYDGGRAAEIGRYAKAWRDAHRGETSEVARLVGFCLAVRRSSFEAVGGFDEAFGIGGCEDDDLCARLHSAGGRLLIAHESFVHHVGHATFDTNGVDWYALQQENLGLLAAKHGALAPVLADASISACLIVKDEEANLPACLEALDGLVDEIVVHDTGSSDATVEIARAAGATVIEGTWDDDFSAARNTALEACTGEWILHVDADELVEADGGALRAELAATSADALHVEVRNLLGRREAPSIAGHRACRLFRRTRAHWEGRLHEQVMPRPGGANLTFADARQAVITHAGYLDEVMQERGKADRNLRLAELDVDHRDDRALALANLGRSRSTAGRYDEAVDAFAEARSLETRPVALRAVLRSGVEALLKAGRATEALEWIAQLRTHSTRTEVADYFEGEAWAALGHSERALSLWAGLGELVDDDGMTYASQMVSLKRAQALTALDRHGEAVDEQLDAVRAGSPLDEVWTGLRASMRAAGRPVESLAGAVDDAHLVTLLGLTLGEDPADADRLGDALWATRPDDPRLLAFAARLGPRLPVLRALEWSVRLRSADLAAECPLVAVAVASDRPVLERLHAIAVTSAAFGDERAEQWIGEVGPLVPLSALRQALLDVGDLAPGLLPVLVSGAATTADRCLQLADHLEELGAADESRVLRQHAASVSM
jgi:GT2 family glycosyltransferase/tetratricopeptide (TPR) repeat protein